MFCYFGTATILKPRREAGEYGPGDHVMAKYKGKPYRAVIVRVKETKELRVNDQVIFDALLKDNIELSPAQILEKMGVTGVTDLVEDNGERTVSAPAPSLPTQVKAAKKAVKRLAADTEKVLAKKPKKKKAADTEQVLAKKLKKQPQAADTEQVLAKQNKKQQQQAELEASKIMAVRIIEKMGAVQQNDTDKTTHMPTTLQNLDDSNSTHKQQKHNNRILDKQNKDDGTTHKQHDNTTHSRLENENTTHKPQKQGNTTHSQQDHDNTTQKPQNPDITTHKPQKQDSTTHKPQKHDNISHRQPEDNTTHKSLFSFSTTGTHSSQSQGYLTPQMTPDSHSIQPHNTDSVDENIGCAQETWHSFESASSYLADTFTQPYTNQYHPYGNYFVPNQYSPLINYNNQFHSSSNQSTANSNTDQCSTLDCSCASQIDIMEQKIKKLEEKIDFLIQNTSSMPPANILQSIPLNTQHNMRTSQIQPITQKAMPLNRLQITTPTRSSTHISPTSSPNTQNIPPTNSLMTPNTQKNIPSVSQQVESIDSMVDDIYTAYQASSSTHEVELVPGYGVRISVAHLDACLRKAKNSGTALARLLVIVFFDDKTLRNSCVKGTKSRPPLDGTIMNAIIKYVTSKRPDCLERDITQAVNQKCADARNLLKTKPARKKF